MNSQFLQTKGYFEKNIKNNILLALLSEVLLGQCSQL